MIAKLTTLRTGRIRKGASPSGVPNSRFPITRKAQGPTTVIHGIMKSPATPSRRWRSTRPDRISDIWVVSKASHAT